MASSMLPLRERRRLQTKREIANVAIELFDERGYDNVTVDEIAARAGVSRATFFRQFARKEDLFFDDWHEKTDLLVAALARMPSDVPLSLALRRAAEPLLDRIEENRDATLRRMRIRLATPSLGAPILADQVARRSQVRQEVARRLGADSDGLLPDLITEAAYAAINAAVNRWFHSEGNESLPQLLDDAFAVLGRGLDLVGGETARSGV